MTKNAMPAEWYQDIEKVCNKWIKGNLSAKEVKESIGEFSWAVLKLLLTLKDTLYVSSQMSILIDDILEMDSISEVEKEEEILTMIDRNKQELKSLAERVIKQIKIDKEEFCSEATKRGYCSSLMNQGFKCD